MVFTSSKFEKIIFTTPEVNIAKLLRIHGYKKNQKIKPVIQDAAIKAVRRLQYCCDPQGVFFLQEIHRLEADRLILISGIEFNCAVFEDILAGSTHIISFAITLGNRTDEIIDSYAKDINEPLASLFLETASRLCLEQILRMARSKLVTYSLNNDMKLGNRMAPGYSYKVRPSNERVMWNLEEQAKLFDTFRKFEVPVIVMESSAMLPRMSRSGIFGLKNLALASANSSN